MFGNLLENGPLAEKWQDRKKEKTRQKKKQEVTGKKNQMTAWDSRQGGEKSGIFSLPSGDIHAEFWPIAHRHISLWSRLSATDVWTLYSFLSHSQSTRTFNHQAAKHLHPTDPLLWLFNHTSTCPQIFCTNYLQRACQSLGSITQNEKQITIHHQL